MEAAWFICAQCGQRYDQGGFCAHDGQPLAMTDDPLLGTEVGRYRLARLLGEGGMGRVYLAIQPAIGSRVAVKILSDQCARNPELLERFFAEARAVNLVNHERIVSVIDLAQLPDGRPFIVMEYVEGQTLASIAAAGPVPLGGIVQVMTEVLSALAAAHAIGIVHRDLKPDNVLVTAEGHAKVLDFGIAKLAPELQQQLSPRTRTGALLGTPQYMAPEQISGAGRVDARTDVYAAGVVLYELITGQQPFVGETLFDLMRAHLETPPRPPRLLRPALPAALEQVILTALNKPPDARFPSAVAMAQALQQAGAALPAAEWRSLSLRARVPGLGPPTGRSSHSEVGRTTRPVGAAPTVGSHSRIGLVIGGVVIAAIAVIATLFFVTKGTTPKPAELAAVSEPTPAPPPAEVAPPPAEVATPGGPPAELPAEKPKPAGKPKPVNPAGAPVAAPAAGSSSAKPPDGPTIVGGGSAADHGVHIGPGVTMGPGVIIGGDAPAAPAGRESIRRPADYNAKRFDPVAYVPKALALARELLPDAQLTSFEFDPVFADGHVDLTMDGRDRGYEFRSPARSVFPAGRPRNLPIDRKCRVSIELSPTSISARVLESDTCDDKLVRTPRCSFASVWKQALAKGVPDDLVARIGWLFDETWFFDTDFEGKGGGVKSFADRCP